MDFGKIVMGINQAHSHRESPKTHLFLSPHFDDAVLSCGGQIASLVRRQDIVIVYTIMAGKPSIQRVSSPILDDLHRRWGAGGDPASDPAVDAVAERRREDIRAVNSLGALARHGAIPDCVYRFTSGPDGLPVALYPDEESLWGQVHPADPAVLLLESMPLIYATMDVLHVPLGAGHHVDHQLVRAWGRRLARIHSAMSVLYYEEYPYSRDAEAIGQALQSYAPATLDPVYYPLDEAALQAKITAIGHYHSQISTFWEDEAAMARSVRADAALVSMSMPAGAGQPVEREWRIAG